MSKLNDRLNALNQPAMPAMGFRKTVADEKKLTLLILVEVTGRGEADVKEIAGLGLDIAVINAAGLSAAALHKMLKNCQNLITGLIINGGKSLNGLRQANGEIDFVICGREMPLKLYACRELEKAGHILRLETALEPVQLRAAAGLYPALDAVLIELSPEELKVNDVLDCRKVAEHSGQPLIVALPEPVSEVELMSLREAGVKALLLPAGWPVDDIKRCLEIVSSLPRPAKKKDRERGTVSLLPHLATAVAKKEEGDQEEDDD